MSKRKVDIKKIPLNNRKITDTNESQITRNFWALTWKLKIVTAFTQCSRVPWPLTHTHVHVANWVFVCSRQCNRRCHSSCFCFMWRTTTGRWKRANEEKNKTPNPKINYVYESIFCRPTFIKYRDSEHRNILNGIVHHRTGVECPEVE